MGVSGIKYSEIAAYCSIIGCRLSEWEVSLIIDVDKKYLSVLSDIRKEETSKSRPGKK